MLHARAGLIGLVLGATALGQTTWTVDDDGGADFTDIQPAIEAAADGDTVLVSPGTYSGIDMLGKAIEVRSTDGPEVTTVLCRAAAPGLRCDSGEGRTTVVQGLGFLPSPSDPETLGWSLDASSPSLRDCVLREIRSGSLAGAPVACALGGPLIENCRFEDNEGKDAGAVLAVDSQGLEVVLCEFVANRTTSSRRGAAVTIEGAQEAELSGCRFESNSGEATGGLHMWDSYFTIAGCEFVANSGVQGGALYAGWCHFTLVEGLFERNDAYWGGAICSFGNGESSLADSRFEGNTAVFGGGAILSPSQITVSRCEFIANSAPAGGASDSGGGGTLFEDCVFERNTAGRGGASTTSGEFRRCEFRENHASEGGALGADAVRVHDSTFVLNVAGSGGAIQAGAFCIVTGSDFEDNLAYTGGGAAACEPGGQLTIRDSTVRFSTSLGDGGAIWAPGGGVLSLSQTDIVGSTAFGDGGGIKFAGTGVVQLSDCTLSGNTSSDGVGGAIVSGDASIEFDACVFEGNDGWLTGAAMLADAAAATLSECAFSHNTSFSGVGGLSLSGDFSPTLDGCWFIGNEGKQAGAIRCADGAGAQARGCVFNSNTGEVVGAVGVFSPGQYPEVLIAQCELHGNTGGEVGAIDSLGAGVALVESVLTANDGGQVGGVRFAQGWLHASACQIIGNTGGASAGVAIRASEDGSGFLLGESRICGNGAAPVSGSWIDLGGNCIQEFCARCDCPGDWDMNGTVNSADFVAYLDDWANGRDDADINADGVVNTRDFVTFLAAWSAGC